MMKPRFGLMLMVLALMFFGLVHTTAAQTVTARSCSLADVQTAVSAAARGATVTVPSGSCTWASTLVLTRGVTLQGDGIGNTVITNSMGGNSPHISIQPDATAIASEEAIRVTGFTMDGGNGTGRAIFVSGAKGSDTKPFKKLIIDDNKFQNFGSGSGDGCIYTGGQVRGVVYKNVFDRCDFMMRPIGDGSYAEWQNPAFAPSYGTEDNLYVEDNIVQFSSSYTSALGAGGMIQAEQGGRLAFRFNTINFVNLTNVEESFDAHGQQYMPGGETGTFVVEYYDNTITGNIWRMINHRGSWGMYFDNVVTGATPVIYASQYQGGCQSDVPAPNTSIFVPEINNTYAFNNKGNGALLRMTAQSGYTYCGVAQNASWWTDASGTFTGGTGIGRGPKASMPATCTAGVGYWATDEGSWNTKLPVNSSGRLYKCVSNNSWQAYYTPYTYPHPMRNLSATGPNPATGLTAAVR